VPNKRQRFIHRITDIARSLLAASNVDGLHRHPPVSHDDSSLAASIGREDTDTLRAALQEIRIESPIAIGPFAMFPLLKSEPGLPSYRLLDDALDAGFATVTETSTGGSVPELLFRNLSDDDILLVDGEELVGAKQNRVLNLTILVGSRQEVRIPVSCVEAGRWAWRSQLFVAGRRGLHARARSEKMGGVSASLREGGIRARRDIQSAVWRSIEHKMFALNSLSETAALHDVYSASEARLEEIRNHFKAQPGQVGSAFAIGGRIVGIEIFDAAETLASLLPKLVDSYAFDAIEIPSDAPRADLPACDRVKEMLQRIASAPVAEYPAVGKGRDVRIDADHLRAAALLVEGRVVHLSAFDRIGDQDSNGDRLATRSKPTSHVRIGAVEPVGVKKRGESLEGETR
jgi:hypothetical protein